MSIYCSLCGEEIANPETADRRVKGWDRARVGGGQNVVRLKEVLPEFAHPECVDRESKRTGGKPTSARQEVLSW